MRLLLLCLAAVLLVMVGWLWQAALPLLLDWPAQAAGVHRLSAFLPVGGDWLETGIEIRGAVA